MLSASQSNKILINSFSAKELDKIEVTHKKDKRNSMDNNKKNSPVIPLTVPFTKRSLYLAHYQQATQGSEKLFLFAGDQKIEHLNQSFYGPLIPKESAHVEHLFNIARHPAIGLFATQLGLIARYGERYPTVPYLVKLNAKTNVCTPPHKDPESALLWNLDHVLTFALSSGLPILGIGLTVYLGSSYENSMLSQAARLIYEAHQNGLITVLWMYPRGASIPNDRDASLIAGAAGVATSLGADFVKINIL
jgi:fructose-bisphosphate aldolase / 6-deoxy-5-ketofructose 1-phosphate synthase